MGRLYSNLKFLQFSDHIAALREQKVVAPVHVRIKPMNRCNHDCWYCAYRVTNLQLGDAIDLEDTMPTEKMSELVGDLIDMGVKAVTFSGGGEPLLYKPLPESIERLAGGGIRVATLTNGSNLKGRVAESFAEHGTWVRVSVDAWDDESYTAARKVKMGSFTQLLENIRRFVDTGTQCVLGVSFIVGKANHAHVYEACSKFKDAGVNHIKLTNVVVANDIAGNNAYHAEISGIVRAQMEKARELDDGGFRIIDHYHEIEQGFDKEYTTCPYLQFLTVIGADCKVYTCQDKAFTESGCLGSIRDRSFKEFWFSEETREKIYALDPSVVCRHHCVTHAKNVALTEILSVDPDHGSFV